MLLHDDVRTLTAEGLRSRLGFLPQVVVGSPPCQDFSAANARGRGIQGERGRLFLEAVRLVGEVRPLWFCFENSPRLRLRGADVVLPALEAHGYAVEPVVVGAVHAGAPHRRQRVWLFGCRLDRLPALEAANDNRSAPAHADGDALRLERQRLPGGRPRALRPRGHALALDPGAGAPAHANENRLPPGRLAQWAGLEGAPWGLALGLGSDGLEHRPHAQRLHPGAIALGPRLEVDQRRAGDAGERQRPAAVGVAWLDAWASWLGGCAGHLRVAHGLSAGLVRQCIAAYGDAVLPDLAELIGRTMVELVPTDGTVLDLFAGGAGGWSLGLHRAGFRTVAAVELDPWRRAVLARNFGSAA